MTFWLALRRLLPLLAVLSLALTPVTASAAAAGMHASVTAQAPRGDRAMVVLDHAGSAVDHTGSDHAGSDLATMAGDDMPCCPPETAAPSDCAKAGCPLMALCLSSVASLLPVAAFVPVPVATRAVTRWPDAASFTSLNGPLLPEPPRA